MNCINYTDGMCAILKHIVKYMYFELKIRKNISKPKSVKSNWSVDGNQLK